MTNLKPGKREIVALAAVLDAEYETVEEAAEAALVKAWEIYESRAKWTVVGQMFYAPHEGYVDSDDARASKVSLGMYPTRGQAEKAGEALAYSTQTHESFRWWCLPVHHGTPAELYRQRKEAHAAVIAEARKSHSSLEVMLKGLSEAHAQGKGANAQGV